MRILLFLSVFFLTWISSLQANNDGMSPNVMSSTCLTVELTRHYWLGSHPGYDVNISLNGQLLDLRQTNNPYEKKLGEFGKDTGYTTTIEYSGCFDSTQLRDDENTFDLNVIFRTGGRGYLPSFKVTYSGISSSFPLWEKMAIDLCPKNEKMFLGAMYYCEYLTAFKDQYVVSLSNLDIDIKLSREQQARKAEQLRIEVEKLQRQIDGLVADDRAIDSQIEPAQVQLNRIEDKLNKILNQPLGQINPEEVKALGEDFEPIADLLAEKNKDAKTVTENNKRLKDRVKEKLLNYNSASAIELAREGIDPNDKSLYDSFQIDDDWELDVASELEDGNEIKDVSDNSYMITANEFIDRFNALKKEGKSGIPVENRLEFLALKKRWTEVFLFLGQSFKNGKGTLLENQSYRQAVGKVDRFLTQYVDENGYFRSSIFYKDIVLRENLGLIVKFEPKKGEELKKVLHTWDETHLTPEQKLVLQTVKALGIAFKVASDDFSNSSQKIKIKLSILTDQSIKIAKMTVPAFDVGTSLAPGINDIRDYCEAMTGKEFCLPAGRDLSSFERLLSGAGLFAGSGAFFRTLLSALSTSIGKAFAPIKNIYKKALDGIERLKFKNRDDMNKFLEDLGEGLPCRLVAAPMIRPSWFQRIIEWPLNVLFTPVYAVDKMDCTPEFKDEYLAGLLDAAGKGWAKFDKFGVKLANKQDDLKRLSNNPLRNTKYAQKVEDQMKLGDYHAFPKEVDNWAGVGNRTTITGGDGIKRTKIELPGSYGGKEGHFEWIIEADGVTVRHRLFVPKR